MRSLRQVKKDARQLAAADVEAAKPKDSAPRPAASAFVTSPGASSHNPGVLAKVIFRKVYTLLVESNEEDLTRPGGFVTLLKDIVLGVLSGVLVILVLIFLDHRGVVHIQSARKFREAAFQMLNDPATVAALEDELEVKFVTVDEYNKMRKEIDDDVEKFPHNQELLQRRTAVGEEKRKELEALRPEYERVKNHEALGINKFCGSCHWGMKTSCDGRVQFLKNTYGTKHLQALIGAMKHESCIKKD